MYEDYFLTLAKRGYSVFDYKACRNCTVFILEKTKEPGKKYMLKLFMSRNIPDGDTFKSWYNSYRLRCEKLGHYRYDEVRIPHALKFWENETVSGFGNTFGVLTDYVSGRTLATALCHNLDNDADRRRLLLQVMPDYIAAIAYGNKAGYYHLDIEDGNLLVDPRNRGWLIDHIGAFICDDYKKGRQPVGGYFHCYSDRIAADSAGADKKAESCRDDGAECERLQTMMLISQMKGIFDRSTTERLFQRCVTSAGTRSPLELLRESLTGMEG